MGVEEIKGKCIINITQPLWKQIPHTRVSSPSVTAILTMQLKGKPSWDITGPTVNVMIHFQLLPHGIFLRLCLYGSLTIALDIFHSSLSHCWKIVAHICPHYSLQKQMFTK